jgi:hypothetical protein
MLYKGALAPRTTYTLLLHACMDKVVSFVICLSGAQKCPTLKANVHYKIPFLPLGSIVSLRPIPICGTLHTCYVHA